MSHNVEIYNRSLEVGRYVVDTKCTVRQAAHQFQISKSTVHKDLTERLPENNALLAEEARKVLDVNKEERYIRGGEATKQKYLSFKKRTFI